MFPSFFFFLSSACFCLSFSSLSLSLSLSQKGTHQMGSLAYIYIYIYWCVRAVQSVVWAKKAKHFTLKPKWTKQKAWDCSPNHVFWKGLGTAISSQFWVIQLTGSEQRCQQCLTSLFVIYTIEQEKRRNGKKCGGKWPRMHIYIYIHTYLYTQSICAVGL